MLKIAIVVLIVALIISLGSALFFLMTDQGDKTKRRTLHSLGVRLSLGVALAALVVYGVATGQLGHSNPWDAGPKTSASQETETE